ncbi:MAG: MerR family transcriptional regulator [Defluviitaleaceae bacterium]|nr:MerR family transcriptional regulator [Defluviitaleaceae bacterium]
MTMANCPRCKKLFPKVYDPICEECAKEEEKLFRTVVDYLRDNPSATVGEVSDATGATAKKILGYLRDGRISISTPELNCRGCGTKIASGNFCDTCAVQNQKDLDELGIKDPDAPKARPKPAPTGPKKVVMHTRSRGGK